LIYLSYLSNVYRACSFFANSELFCIDNARVIYKKIRYLDPRQEGAGHLRKKCMKGFTLPNLCQKYLNYQEQKDKMNMGSGKHGRDKKFLT
jgi:hypothetical protein